jgi:hypothetical protein
MAYLDELRDMISQVHGADATHVESVQRKRNTTSSGTIDSMLYLQTFSPDRYRH